MNKDTTERVKSANNKVSFILGELAQKKRNIENVEKQISFLKKELFTLEAVSQVFGKLSEQSQKQVKEKIEQMVSYALTKVFERKFRFFLNFKVMRRNSVVNFQLASDETNGEPVNLMDARGGGVCEVAGFVLRIICLLFLKRTQRQILFLDEPFSWVSTQYVPNLLELITELSSQTGIQFVVITHNDEVALLGDKQYKFRLKDGSTIVESIK